MKVFLSVLLTSLGLVACGPMNSKPTAAVVSAACVQSATHDCSGTGAPVSPTNPDHISFSTQHNYIVMARIKDPTVTADKSATGKGMTRNLEVRVAHTSDWAGLEKDATVNVTYEKFDKTGTPSARTLTATVDRKPNGSMNCKMEFKKAGDFNVHVTVTEKGVTDEHTFALTLQ